MPYPMIDAQQLQVFPLSERRSYIEIAEEAQRNGLLVNCTQHNVLRIMPPLTITRDEADLGLSILKQCLN